MTESPPGNSGGWPGARRELAVAGTLVVTLAAAAWAVDGPAAAVLVALICVAASFLVLGVLVHPEQEPLVQPEHSYEDGPLQSFTGFWRTQTDLAEATRRLSTWDYALRPRLTNLLAARLADHHGISLAGDPEAARLLLHGGGASPDLWFWIDPQRQVPADAATRTGIPPRVLAALIKRLEQL
jgi:hypothetical protein